MRIIFKDGEEVLMFGVTVFAIGLAFLWFNLCIITAIQKWDPIEHSINTELTQPLHEDG